MSVLRRLGAALAGLALLAGVWIGALAPSGAAQPPIVQLLLSGGLCAAQEAQAVVNAMPVKPTGGRVRLIDDTICKLKQAGAWTAFDAFWMLAAHDTTASTINWKRPGTFDLTLSGPPTFTVDRGITTNGTTRADGPNVSSFGGQFVQDSAHMALFAGTDVTENQADFGSANSVIRAHATATTITTRANANVTQNSTLAVNTAVGLTMWNRCVSGNYDVWKDGSNLGNIVQASTGIANTVISIGGSGGTGAATKQYSWAAIGKCLTTGQPAAVYTTIRAWMTAVGAPTS